VPSRERLLRLAETGAALATTRRVRVFTFAILIAGLVFLVVRLRSTWRHSGINPADVQWAWLAGAIGLGVAAVIASSLIWLTVLQRLGSRTHWPWAGIYFQAQLGKYLPGSLWQYAGRGSLAKVHGVSVRTVAKSLPVELAATTFAAAAFSLLALGWWGALGLGLALVITWLLPILADSAGIATRATIEVVRLYGAVWVLIGVSFWMTCRAFVPVAVADGAFYTGSFALAWLVGLVAIYAPGGIGVREAVLVALLHSRIGTADALVIAAASRGVFTMADLIAAAISVPLLRRPSPRIEPAPRS
jgi:uncharacterized membrane protein YbhN (UPF0104 family)